MGGRPKPPAGFRQAATRSRSLPPARSSSTRSSLFGISRATVVTACVLLMVAVYPSFLMASSGGFAASIVGVMLLAIGAVLCGVVTAALLSETFPTRTRYTASAITYNMAYTLFGGTAPLVATWLISTTGSNMSPAFYLIAVALLALAGGLALPETSRISLHDVATPENAAQAVAAV